MGMMYVTDKAKREQKFNNVVMDEGADFHYDSERGIPTYCSFYLFIIGQARSRGCNFEDLADGYGKGCGTHGDWSGIRDSSDEAVCAMFERSLNWLFK